MAILTCKNHPNLRWSCKDIAVNSDGSYNGARDIFFNGEPTGKGMYDDLSGLRCSRVRKDGTIVNGCDCPPKDLIFAPEDKLVKRY